MQQYQSYGSGMSKIDKTMEDVVRKANLYSYYEILKSCRKRNDTLLSILDLNGASLHSGFYSYVFFNIAHIAIVILAFSFTLSFGNMFSLPFIFKLIWSIGGVALVAAALLLTHLRFSSRNILQMFVCRTFGVGSKYVYLLESGSVKCYAFDQIDNLVISDNAISFFHKPENRKISMEIRGLKTSNMRRLVY